MTLPLADWLALREPFDAQARSAGLTRLVAESLPARRPLRIVDLGTGRGSNVRYLSPRLPLPQDWLLVDREAALLHEIPRAMAGVDPRCHVAVRQQELGVLDASLFDGRDLVTASALLDLVSDRWLRALASRCGAAGAVVLFALTYNGEFRCLPAEPEDETVRGLLNRHQRSNDKGFGTAAGPDATTSAAQAFAAEGYRVEREASDWHLPPDARALQRQLVEGWAAVAVELEPDRTHVFRDWMNRRLDHIDAGRSRIVVCHEDLAAWPAS